MWRIRKPTRNWRSEQWNWNQSNLNVFHLLQANTQRSTFKAGGGLVFRKTSTRPAKKSSFRQLIVSARFPICPFQSQFQADWTFGTFLGDWRLPGVVRVWWRDCGRFVGFGGRPSADQWPSNPPMFQCFARIYSLLKGPSFIFKVLAPAVWTSVDSLEHQPKARKMHCLGWNFIESFSDLCWMLCTDRRWSAQHDRQRGLSRN